MRINAVFSKKVATAQYENETYTVTVEAESEFNNVDAVADYLFNQARTAVQRQIEGAASSEVPQSSIPKQETADKAPQGSNNGERKEPEQLSKGNGFPATEKQVSMVKKLLKENFKDGVEANRWLRERFSAESTTALTRKVASRVIEALLERRRQVA